MADYSNPYLPDRLQQLGMLLSSIGAGVSGAEASGRSGWAGLGPAAMMYGGALSNANQNAIAYDQWQQNRQVQDKYRQAQEDALRAQTEQRAADAKAKQGMGQAVLSALSVPGMSVPNATPTMGPGDLLSRSGTAIAGIESGGQYGAVGPETGKGRAYGKYQVMDFNVGPWTREVLGTEMTPQQFLASPDAQEAVFKAKFGGAISQYGNPQDAASWWFSGMPLAGNTAGPDVNGTTVAGYVNKFNRGMYGGGGSVVPVQAGGSEPQIDPQTLRMIQAIAIKDPEAAAKLLIQARQGLKKEDAYEPLNEGSARMFLGPAYDPTKAYQRNRVTGKIEPIGGSLVNINNQSESAFTRQVAEQDAKMLGDLQANTRTVVDTAAKVQMATDLFAKTYTGPGAGTANDFFKILGSLGVDAAKDKSNAAAAATAIISEMMPKMRAPGSGATSDFEMRTFAAALPGMLNMPGGNELVAQYWQRIADRALAIQSLAEKHALESKGLTGTTFAKDVKALGPLFSKEELDRMQGVAKSAPKDRPPLDSILNGQPTSLPLPPLPGKRPSLDSILGPR